MNNPKRVIGKACARCGGVERYKNHGSCCACASERAKAQARANPEHRKALAVAWNAANRDKRRAYAATARAKNPTYIGEWAKAHPEKTRAAVRRWRAHNPDKVRANHARWSSDNPGRASALTRAWQLAHPDEAKVIRATRRARKLNAVVGCRKEYAAFVKWARIEPVIHCHYCDTATLPGKRHLDHYIPLAKGGEDSVANLRVACAKCNQCKHALLPEEFIERIA